MNGKVFLVLDPGEARVVENVLAFKAIQFREENKTEWDAYKSLQKARKKLDEAIKLAL